MSFCLPDELKQLASRVDRNVPRHGDPEAFHVEKSEIARELRRIATTAEERVG